MKIESRKGNDMLKDIRNIILHIAARTVVIKVRELIIKADMHYSCDEGEELPIIPALISQLGRNTIYQIILYSKLRYMDHGLETTCEYAIMCEDRIVIKWKYIAFGYDMTMTFKNDILTGFDVEN